MKATKLPTLSKYHKEKSTSCPRKYMKIDFSIVFTDKCRATLNERDNQTGVCALYENRQQACLKI